MQRWSKFAVVRNFRANSYDRRAYYPRRMNKAPVTPLYILCGVFVLCAKLRRSNIDASAGAVDEVDHIVEQIRPAYCVFDKSVASNRHLRPEKTKLQTPHSNRACSSRRRASSYAATPVSVVRHRCCGANSGKRGLFVPFGEERSPDSRVRQAGAADAPGMQADRGGGTVFADFR